MIRFILPLFHICAYLVIKIAVLFGVQCSIYAAFNITWIIASGVIFPAGMLVLCRYFLQRWNRGNPISNPISRISQALSTSESSSVSESSNISNQQVPSAGNRQYDAASDATFVLQNLIGLFVPVLAVSSVCHPYGLLNAGPLIAFGFAMSLLPFLIAATLRLFDAIAAREHIAKWLAITAVAGVVCLVAHPRIAFHVCSDFGAVHCAALAVEADSWRVHCHVRRCGGVCGVDAYVVQIGPLGESRFLVP